MVLCATKLGRLTTILVVALCRARIVLGFATPAVHTDQLSWEDLGRTLLNLRAGGVPDEVLMMTRMSIDNLSRARIGPSRVPDAGRGLFAAMDCREGDLLTCYPGDVLLRGSEMIGLTDELKADREKLRSLASRYCIGVAGEYAVMGLPDLDQDVAYAGHFINDGARPPRTESELESYVWESGQMANAEHLPLENLHMVTVATRDIKEGEEILVLYGPTYWREHTLTWLGGKRP